VEYTSFSVLLYYVDCFGLLINHGPSNTVTIQIIKIATQSWRKVVCTLSIGCVWDNWLLIRLQCCYVLRLQGVMKSFVVVCVCKCCQQLPVWTERIVTFVVFKCWFHQQNGNSLFC